jgi:hypothetical protein
MAEDLGDRIKRYRWRELLSKRRFIVGMVAFPILVFASAILTDRLSWSWWGFLVALVSYAYIGRRYFRLKKEDRDWPDWKGTLWVRPPTRGENPDPF